MFCTVSVTGKLLPSRTVAGGLVTLVSLRSGKPGVGSSPYTMKLFWVPTNAFPSAELGVARCASGGKVSRLFAAWSLVYRVCNVIASIAHRFLFPLMNQRIPLEFTLAVMMAWPPPPTWMDWAEGGIMRAPLLRVYANTGLD